MFRDRVYVWCIMCSVLNAGLCQDCKAVMWTWCDDSELFGLVKDSVGITRIVWKGEYEVNVGIVHRGMGLWSE